MASRKVSADRERGQVRRSRVPLPTVASSAIGSLGTALSAQVVLLGSGILAARLLGPENRGHLALLALIPAIVCQIGLLGVKDAITYYIAKDSRSAAGIARSMVIPVVAQIAVCILLHLVALWFLVRSEAGSVQTAGLLTLIVTPASLVFTYGLAILQGMQRFRAFNILRLLQPLLYALVLPLAIFVDDTRLTAIAFVWSISFLLASMATAVVTIRSIPWAEDAASPVSGGELFRFGLKGFLGSVSPLETFRLDQAIVGLFLSPTALGIYVASLALTNLPRFVAQSIGMVAFPHIAGQSEDRLARRSMWRFFWVTLAGSVVVALALAVAANQLLPFVFGSEFRDAVVPAQILLVGSALFGARRVLGEGMRGRGYPAANTIAEVVSWVWLVPALIVMAPRWGLKGVAIALVGASIVSLGVLVGVVIASGRTMQQARQPTARFRQLSDPRSWRRQPVVAPGARRLLLVVVVLGGAVISGWVSTNVPPMAFVFGGVAFAFIVALLVMRRALRWLQSSEPSPLTSRLTSEQDRSSALALPRLLYYCGAATVAILSIRPTSQLTISDWFFFGSLMLTLAVLLLKQELTFEGLPSGLLIGTLIFSCGAFISSSNTSETIASITILVRFVYLTVAWFWLGTVVLQTPKHVRTAIVCWATSVALTGLASIAQLLFGNVIPGTTPEWGRMTGFAQHFNDLGGSTSVALVPAIMIPAVMRGWVSKLVALLMLFPFVASGLLLSGSVGGLTAGVAGVAVWVGMGRLGIKTIGIAVVAILGVVAILSLQQSADAPSPIERFHGATDAQSQYCTLCSRLETSRVALDEISHSPFIGVGLDPVSSTTSTGSQVHNMLIGPWYESGILGLFGMVFILGSVGLVGIRALRCARSHEEWTICLALLCSFFSFFVIGMGQPMLFQRYGWIGAAFLLVIRRQQVARTSMARVRASDSRRHQIPLMNAGAALPATSPLLIERTREGQFSGISRARNASGISG